MQDALPAVLYWSGNAFAFWAFYTFIPLYLVQRSATFRRRSSWTWLATYQVWAIGDGDLSRQLAFRPVTPGAVRDGKLFARS